jgi:hypothetical protein
MDFEQIIRQILKEKGYEIKVDQETFNGFVEDGIEKLSEKLLYNYIQSIPNNYMKDFDIVMESGDQLATQAFFTKHIPNINELSISTIADFKENYF